MLNYECNLLGFICKRASDDSIGYYRARSTEERRSRRMPNREFFYFAWCVRKIAMLHDWKSAIEHGGAV